MPRRILPALALALLAAAFSGAAHAQLNRGSITGIVSDPSGAVLPAAQITVRNSQTGVNYPTRVTDAGQYTAPNLPPGTYELAVTAPGFKRLVRPNVEVGATDVIRVDMVLEIGQTSESVEVTAEIAQVQSETREVAQALGNKDLLNLPLSFSSVRSPENFAYKITPGVTGNFWTSHINGSMQFSKEVVLDGASATTQLGGDFTTGMVSVEAVGEFKVVTSGMSAEFGRSQGGLFNFVMKSGTNDAHGSLFGTLRNEALNANSFSNKARGLARPLDRKQIMGGSFGGPVWIPKIYNGRSKTFFYFAYEKYRERNFGMSAPNRTVPIPDFYNGDFSRLLGTATGQKDALNRDVLRGAIYDPASFSRLENGRWTGEMFPGNRIPVSRFSGVSRRVNAIAQQYYKPVVVQADGQFALLNNSTFPVANAPVWDNHQLSLKADQNITDKHKISGSWTYVIKNRSTLADAGGLWSPGESDGGPFSAARSQRLATQYERISYDAILTPTILNNVTASFNWLHAPTFSKHVDVDGAKELGIKNLSTFGFPTINWGGGPIIGLTNLGDPQRAINDFMQYGFLDTLSFSKGRHFLKAGIDLRWNQLNTTVTQGGGFNFAARATAIPGESFSGNLTGYAMASYLLGIVDSAGLNDPIKLGGRKRYLGAFLQDDFKATNRLTLQIGLRWEFQPPQTEQYDRLSSWSASKTDPVSGRPGAYEFAGTCNGCTGKRYFGQRSYRDWGPRVGVAYRLSDKTTFRGGYGIFFAGDVFNGFNATPLGKQTNVQAGGTFALNADPVNPWAGIFNWDNGMPTTAYLPAFNDVSWGNRNNPGQIDPRYGKTPYIQDWNINLQREILPRTVLDVGYIANKSTGLWNGVLDRTNQLPWSAVERYGRTLTNPVRNAAEAQANGVAYPYAGYSGTVAGALRQFPQVNGIATVNNFGAPWGFSTYHSLQVSVNRQFSKGLSVQANYVWSKVMANTQSLQVGDNPGPLDFYNLKLEKAPATFDQPHLVKAFVDYQLPFGRGKAMLGGANKFLNALVSGWNVNAILNYFSGTPLGFGGSFPLSGGWNGATNRANIGAGDMKTSFDFHKFNLMNVNDPGNTYLNKSLFSDPAPLTLGTSAPRYTQTRGFGTRNEDIGIQKNFSVAERYRFQLRADLLNAFNRHTLGGINTSVTSPQFGQVTSVGGIREVQMGLRLDF